MNFKEITQIIEQAEKSSLTYIEIKNEDFKIVLKKEKETVLLQSPQVVETPVAAHNQASNQVIAQTEQVVQKPDNIKVIKAPMVGTFYSAPSPDADSFVKVGDIVKTGDTVCILEAMKLMNEIESEFEGTIVNILVENEQMVEYGQPLFEIEVK